MTDEESMVERVARAYWHWRLGITSNKPCDELDLSLARTVIAAMREPTDAMLGSGAGWFLASEAREIWQSMIDAALKS